MPNSERLRRIAIVAFVSLAAGGAWIGIVLGARGNIQPPRLGSIAGGSPRLPTSAGGHCGTIVVAATVTVASDSPLDAQACFARAFSACSHGDLTIFNQGVDNWSSDHLTVGRSGKACRITDHEKSVVAGIGQSSHDTDHCASASAGPDGLTLFGCQDGSAPPWVVPVPSNEPVYVGSASIVPGTGIVGIARGTGCHDAGVLPSGAFPSSQPCPTYQAAFGASIVAMRDDREVAHVMVGPDGGYQLPLAAGNYQVTAQLPSSTTSAEIKQVTVTAGTVDRVDIGIDCWYNCE